MRGFTVFLALAIAAVYYYIWYRFVRTLWDTLGAVGERNRAMRPNLVWLNFVPVFNLVWMFVTVIKIRDSARAEFVFRGLRMKEDLSYGSGMAFAVAGVLSAIYVPAEMLTNEGEIMVLGILSRVVGAAFLTSWLVFWGQASRLRGLLLTAAPADGSAASPDTHPGYQPRSWQLPLESSPGSTQTDSAAPWLGRRPPTGVPPHDSSSGEQSLQQQSSAGTVGPGTCPHCGAVYSSDKGYCLSCGRSAV